MAGYLEILDGMVAPGSAPGSSESPPGYVRGLNREEDADDRPWLDRQPGDASERRSVETAPVGSFREDKRAFPLEKGWVAIPPSEMYEQ